MPNEKYLENWVSGVLYGYQVERLEIDDNFEIILEKVRGKSNVYRVKLKDGRAIVARFTLNDMADKDVAKLHAIKSVSDFLHKAAIRYAYGSTNLRVLSGVSMVE